MPAVGKVYLVGAGPGDPGLLTVRGRDCLAQADLVLYDGLVNPLLLRHAAAHAHRTSRMSGPDGQHLHQTEINNRLIEAARAGEIVVRLKGGDPFIFGRGSEEAAALAEAGIPYEVVPGITAATAAGVYAGISYTHRELASAVAFITGHEDPAKPASALDYRALAAFPGTLVFYMGLHRVAAIATALIDAGLNPQTPAAVVCRATTPHQRTVTAPLADLAAAVQQAALRPPSLIIVGECVRQREQIAWFEQRPLLGQRIGITRPEEQADAAIARCLELGADPILMPTIDILPPESWTAIDAVLPRLSDYDWLVLTSANGVRSLLGRMWEQGLDARALHNCRIATIGPATAAALQSYGLRADLVPDSYRAEALAAALGPHVNGARILWARANRGRDVLPISLREAGATVEELVVYRNIDRAALPADVTDLIARGDLHWIALSSPSIARQLAELWPPNVPLGTGVRFAAISPLTAAAAAEAGFPVSTTAEVFTWHGLLDAIVQATA